MRALVIIAMLICATGAIITFDDMSSAETVEPSYMAVAAEAERLTMLQGDPNPDKQRAVLAAKKEITPIEVIVAKPEPVWHSDYHWSNDCVIEPRLVSLVDEVTEPYGVRMTVAEGLWVAERLERRDWLEWGETADEAIILFLGPGRIAAEVSPTRLAELQQEWELFR
tara:strand:- start:3601 stop:4104 length:504 start_codon:yes stop_codon:yes gene_type:complete